MYPRGAVDPASAAPRSNRRKLVSDQPMNPPKSAADFAALERELRKWQSAVVGLSLCLVLWLAGTWWYVSKIDPRGKTIEAGEREPVRIRGPDGSVTEIRKFRDAASGADMEERTVFDKDGRRVEGTLDGVIPADKPGMKPAFGQWDPKTQKPTPPPPVGASPPGGEVRHSERAP
jgi:hypothetical protein